MNQDFRSDDLLHRIALLTINGIGCQQMRRLLSTYGSAEAVFHADPAELERLPLAGRTLADRMRHHRAELLERARRELDFMEGHQIRPLSFDAPDYPRRLLRCADAPVLLYALGPAHLDAPLTVAIVGTRRCTQYGLDMTRRFIQGLQQRVPDALIISGLALGIDGAAHSAALAEGLPTVGVLAHGLDHIYPAAHRSLAAEMLHTGGLLTEYHSYAHIDRGNFLARNRIVAGLADAVLVVESSKTGGSLVTAHIARGYDRRVCAYPGRAMDERSQGCNDLIRRGDADLITSADDLLELLGMATEAQTRPSVQQELPFDDTLTPDEQRILEYLRDHNEAETTALGNDLGLDSGLLFELLLKLEMDNRIRTTKGNRYELK